MDAVTTLISSMNNGFLTLLSLLVYTDVQMAIAAIIVGVAGTLIFKEKKRIPLLVLTVLIGISLSLIAKEVSFSARPCQLVEGKVPCPETSSFPSGHAIAGFSMAAASIGAGSFLLYFPFAVFVAFSRVYLGLHSFPDIAAGLAVSFISYALAKDALSVFWRMKNETDKRD